MDPMIPGYKVVAIFGFCDIRDFTNATEILQEKIIHFVNEIEEVVHREVNKLSVAANKTLATVFCWFGNFTINFFNIISFIRLLNDTVNAHNKGIINIIIINILVNIALMIFC